MRHLQSARRTRYDGRQADAQGLIPRAAGAPGALSTRYRGQPTLSISRRHSQTKDVVNVRWSRRSCLGHRQSGTNNKRWVFGAAARLLDMHGSSLSRGKSRAFVHAFTVAGMTQWGRLRRLRKVRLSPSP